MRRFCIAILIAGLIEGLAPVSAAETDIPPEFQAEDRPYRLIDIIDLDKEAVEILRNGDLSDGERMSEARWRMEAAAKRLHEINTALQTSDGQWKWTSAQQAPMNGGAREKFVIDPPIEGGAAVAIQSKKGRVTVRSLKVIPESGASMAFPVDRDLSAGDSEKVIRYLYYPTDISTIVVSYGSERDARERLSVWAGVAELPEYGKEALYWHRLAEQDIREGEFARAAERLQKAIVKTYLFRRSRGRE